MREFRNCLGRFATGVTVVTCQTERGPHGFTANAFTSVSLDPPLVLVSVDRRAKACRYLEGRPFAVHVLAKDQEPVALHFAGKPQPGLAWRWEPGEAAARIAGALACIECSPWRSYDGGDHVLYVGRVERFAYRDGEPLLFYAGKFQKLQASTAG